MSKSIIRPNSTAGDSVVTKPNDPMRAATIVDCTTGTNYTARVNASGPVQVGVVAYYLTSGSTTTKCGTVAEWKTITSSTVFNSVVSGVSKDCSGCSGPTGSATTYHVQMCSHDGLGTYGGLKVVYDPSGFSPSNGDLVKISQGGSGAGNNCCIVISKATDSQPYSSSYHWAIHSDGSGLWSDCEDCLGVTTRPPLYLVAFITPCSGGTSVIARIGNKEVNVNDVVKYVTTSGSTSTVACGTVHNIQYDTQSAAIIADGVVDCSSCDDSTSGSDDWFTVWQCDSDVIEIVFDKDSVSGVALDEVVRYTKDGDSSSYCGTVTSNAISGTYSSGDMYIESVETDCSSCASGGGSNFTITPCDGGSDIIADDALGENPSVGDVVGYDDGLSDTECGTVSGTTSSSASYSINGSGYIDCDDCQEVSGGGGEGGGGP